jgi:hypothetical protein
MREEVESGHGTRLLLIRGRLRYYQLRFANGFGPKEGKNGHGQGLHDAMTFLIG